MRMISRLFLFLTMFSAMALADELDDVEGIIRVEGKIPAIVEVGVNSPESTCGLRRAFKSVRFIKGYLLDAVVWLTDLDGAAVTHAVSLPNPASPSLPVIVRESHCEFSPRVTIVKNHTPFAVMNDDSKAHWLILEIAGIELVQKLHEAGENDFKFTPQSDEVVTLKSGLHPWMKGFVKATESDYFAAVTESGKFTIPDVPHGDYLLHAWHPILGLTVQPISVPEHGKMEVVYGIESGDNTGEIRTLFKELEKESEGH